jgi:hypothetical protein
MKTTETTFYESSTIKCSQYNFKDKILLVTFNSGTTYQYDNVDVKIYEKFSMAESQGKALNEHIKNTEIKATKIS